MVECHEVFCLDIEVVQALRCLGKLELLIIFTHESLYHTNGTHIFLNTGIELVVLLEDLRKQLRDMGNNISQGKREDDQSHDENQTHADVDDQTHHDGQYQTEWRTDGNPENLLVSILQVVDIRRHSCNQTRRRVFIYIRKGKTLDITIHRLAEIGGKARRGISGKPTGKNAKGKTQKSHTQHNQSIEIDILNVTRIDSLVNQHGGDVRNQHIHHHFQCCEERR